jgi:hypothetical protein
MLLYYLNNILMGGITGLKGIISSTPLDGLIFDHLGENVYVELPQTSSLVSTWFIRLILPIILWSITWLRFTEKEI